MHSECPKLSDIQDCPIFEPTKEEFTDPIDYITKIRPIGEKTGIVKIRPPSDWKPPFCRHPEQFLFSPRIQCLKEVEGVNRVKLNFTDNFIHFWDLHGQKIIKPIVGGQPLDLYKFFDLVNKEGGYNLTCTRKLWSGIGRQLGLNSDVQWSSVLKDKYRKLLYPFEYFIKLRCLLYRGEKLNDCFYSNPRGKIRPLFPIYIQYEEVMCYAVESQTNKSAPDLGPIVPVSADNSGTTPSRSGQGRDIMCQACNKGDEEHVLLICESCEAGFHTFCLYPALEFVPPGDWRCPGCIHRLYTPSSSFGFEHSKQTYTLSTFSHLANLFKRNYFDQPIEEVPYSLVEREFWCLLASPETPVEVQYGADLHSAQHGSGFPCSPSDCYPSEEHYIESGWNLNNIAYLEGCVLKHVPGDISGLKKPWLYVGMCFSTFCWHVEDHWNHSINYLHHGEPKSWYGVPPYAAEKFEACFRKYVPGLFVNDPQLLHHLITMIPPTVLMDSGVPVFRTHQKVGEFVVTFPRAYHAGYNQGFNFAEAVNFATKDWFHLGRECVQIYKEIQKSPIFSHNELVCRCFACPKTPGSFSPSLLADIRKMVTVELENRNRVFQTTMDHAQMNFELLPERERNCRVCKEMLFLSAVVCDSCKINRLCLDHIEEPCPCDGSGRVFQYRYSGQDLLSILENVNRRSEEYKEWLGQVEAVASSREHEKRTLGDVEELYERGKSLNFDSYSPGELELVINRAKLVSKRAQHILSRRSRAKRSGTSLWLYELEELQQLADELDCLPCTIPQSQSIQEKFLEANTILQSIKQLLESNSLIVEQLAESLSQIQQLQVHSPLCDQLSDRFKTATWMQQYRAIYDRCQEDGSYKPQLQEVQTIFSMSHELPVTCEQVQAGVVWLNEAISQAKQWQGISDTALNGENKRSLQILQEIYEENARLMIAVPVPCELTKAIRDAQTWSQNFSTLSCPPSLSQVQALVEEASILPVYLPDVEALYRINSEAESWIHRLSEMFLPEDTEADLIFSLLPKEASQDPTSRNQQNIMDCLNSRSRHIYQQEAQLIKSLWKQEVSAIREIRKTNMAILHTASAPYPPLDKIICVTCDKCASEQMIFCNLCLSLQHGPCAGLSLSNIEVTQNTFVCTKCVRTNRPLLLEAKAILATWSLELNCSYTRVLEILIERGERWEGKSTRMLDSFRQVEMEIDYPEGSTPPPPQTDQSPLHLAQHYKSIEEHLVEGLSIELTLEHTSSCVELWREAYRQSRKGRERGRKGVRHSSKPAPYHPRKHRMTEKKEADASADRWSDSSEDTCAALNCTCVQEQNVDWIQCDACEAWFHFICVRLTRSEVNTMDDYTCPTCSLVEPK